MRPITKFVFKPIYNGNIFYAFRKVIPSVSYSKIKAIKVLGINFWQKFTCSKLTIEAPEQGVKYVQS